MNSVSSDNGEGETGRLEVRFHSKGRADEYAVLGTIVCRGDWADCELAPDLGHRLPESLSTASVAANLQYLTIISRPRPFETLRAMDSHLWSFVPSTPDPSQFDS
jgi:hypothetical protein